MEELNNLEKSIIEKLSMKYSFIEKHIPYLRIKSREITGVGMYINLDYSDRVEKLDVLESSISTDDNIKVEGLKYGLGYEVDISDGMIKFIEIFTYGEEWNGNVTNFTF